MGVLQTAGRSEPHFSRVGTTVATLVGIDPTGNRAMRECLVQDLGSFTAHEESDG